MSEDVKRAVIKTINGEFNVAYANSRDFINGLRSAIQTNSIYEFHEGNTRTFLTGANIVSVELASEAVIPLSPFRQNIIPVRTPEELRAEQLAMQPDIVKFEAKNEAMKTMKTSEDAARQSQYDQIYGKKKSTEALESAVVKAVSQSKATVVTKPSQRTAKRAAGK